MRNRRIFALVVPVLLIGAIAAVRGWAAPGSSSMDEGSPIPSPTNWVALSADFAKDFPGDQIDVAGRYFRASDGSDRLETGPANEPARVVFIRNIPESTYYSRRVDKDGSVYWLSGPMQLPREGWRPSKMREIAGRIMLLDQEYEGRPVVQISSKGNVRLMSPSLNFLTVVSRDVVTGYQELYKNVRLGEQSRDLFNPPPGDTIRRTKEVFGIKARSVAPRESEQ
jgi:hypothetical protein